MKKFVVLIAVVAISYTFASAQSCLPDGITFGNQAQIDNFQTDYPGCTVIDGNVSILGDDITNLNGLSVLTSIGGNLAIGDFDPGNPVLTSLDGLENLVSIGGNLAIIYNHSLVSLAGLHNVYSIGGCFEILLNTALINLSGLEGLTSIGNHFYIDGNNSLISLAGLHNLSTIGTYCEISGNYALINFTGLESLTSIGTYFKISGNDDLVSLAGLSSLASVGGALNIWYNFSLNTLAGLESLTSIGGNMFILGNPSLSALTGLENLTSIGGSLSIRVNSNLSVCDTQWLCNYLSEPAGVVSIFGNSDGCNLADIANACGDTPCLPFGDYYFHYQSDIDNFSLAFPDCIELNGNVIINGNNITSLDGLSQVTSIGGSLSIGENWGGNPSLVSLSGLENLTAIGGGLLIQRNPSLSNLTGLDSLASIGGFFRIISNHILSSLNGPVNLTAIGGAFEIRANIALTDLIGIESLSSIAGSLIIGGNYNGNPALTSLEGLSNLTSLGGSLHISYNSALSTCNAEWLCDLLSNTGGSVTILNNAPGCNSVVDIALSCGGLSCLPNGNYSFYSQTDINNLSQAFPGCTELEGNVTISGNSITDLHPLSHITSVGEKFEISGNSTLQSLMGIENLNAVGSGLVIQNNLSLTNLSGLQGLTFIGGMLYVGGMYSWSGNPSLTSLAGIENISAGSISTLRIFNNTSLSTCEVKSICDYLAAPTGAVFIFSNAPGCNSRIEVEDACLTIGIETGVNSENGFTVFPNPFSNELTIEFWMKTPGLVSVEVFSIMGQQLAILFEDQLPAGQHEISFSAGKILSGIYYLRLQSGEMTITRKIIKQ